MDFSNRVRTVNSYMRDIDKEALLFHHPVQRRSSQWSKRQKSLLIHSLITGYVPVPPIHVLMDEQSLWVIDGKQRLNTIWEFLNDEFRLSKETPEVEDSEGNIYSLAGARFSNLPEEFQDNIKSAEIIQVKYADYTDQQIADVYARLNNGTPLSNDQKLRAELSDEMLNEIDQILSKPFFTEKVSFTAGQVRKGEDLTIILQAIMLAEDMDFRNFSGKEVERCAKEMDISMLNGLSEASDKLDQIVENRSKLLKKINLPMILAGQAVAEDDEAYAQKLMRFFDEYENNEDYKQFCMTSTSKKENVLGRWSYFKE